MAKPRTFQDLIHWIEVGPGARWVRAAAVAAAVLLISVVVSWKQFHGPALETTLLQADEGRQLAAGAGFTTLVNYPQTAAFLARRGRPFDRTRPYPELHEAPLYPLVIAAGLRLLPEGRRADLFARPPVPPDGFKADYFLLVLNVGLFWLALFLTHALARALFDPPAAWLASLALLASVPVWQRVVSLDGTPLLMVLALAAFLVWWKAQTAANFRAAAPALAALGLLCGGLFLAEYSAGTLVLVAAAGAALTAGRRAGGRTALVILAGFAVVAAPWAARNIALTGNPVGLAAQNLALKAGDSTAEPSEFRATFSATPPRLDVDKLANKALSSIQEDLRSRLWSGGALWLAAFFVAGWLYAFRSAPVNRLRWLFTASLAVLLVSQAVLGSGESPRLVSVWLAPLIVVFGAGFFFVLLGSHPVLSRWPRLCAGALLVLQALPLLHDALEPRGLHFQYPPYYPPLLRGMRLELDHRGGAGAGDGRFGLMADVPAGLAWYSGARAWAQPPTLHDFYAVHLEQPIGELLLTPRTLDRPFFSDLNARPRLPELAPPPSLRLGEWGEVYGGLLTGSLPVEFPLGAPQKVADNLYVLVNPALMETQAK